jgi:hypothetical protein
MNNYLKQIKSIFHKTTYRNFIRKFTKASNIQTNSTNNNTTENINKEVTAYDISDISDAEDIPPSQTIDIQTTINIEESEISLEQKSQFNFESFEKRNKNISSNNFKFDESVLNSLKELISNDKSKNMNEPKDLEIRYTDDTTEENKQRDILVKRPGKNFQWGLGNQVKTKSCK